MTSTDAFSVVAQFNEFRDDIPLKYRTMRPWSQAVELAEAFARGLDGSMFTSGRAPSTVAAAGLYVAPMVLDACDETFTQDQVSDWTGVSSVSIRNVYEDLPMAYAAQVDAADVPDAFLDDVRSWVRFTGRRRGARDGIHACPDCDRFTPLLDADDAAQHYADEHPFQRYDPVWFVADADDGGGDGDE